MKGFKGMDAWMMGGKGMGMPWGDPWSMMKGGGGGGCGWGGGGGGAGWGAAAAPSSAPAVLNLAVDPSTQLPAQGFATEAPAVVWDKTATVFSSAANILQEVGADVQIEHDADWTKYPEVAQAVKQAAGGEEHCIAVAMCPAAAAWAVGLAAGWQGRERAAKAAMALALTAGNTEQMTQLSRTYPDFGAMCVAAGLLSPDACPMPAGGGFGGMGGGGGGGGGGKKRSAPAADWGPPAGGSTGDGPPCFWIEMPPTSSVCVQGLPPTGLIVLSGGSPYKSFFSHAASIYSEMCEGLVTIVDDPDWTKYPDVAEMVKATPGGEENCIAIAFSQVANVWAAGLASGKKPREAAVKMAISIALAPYSEKFPSVASGYPEFAQLCESAGVQLPEGVSGKKRAIAWP